MKETHARRSALWLLAAVALVVTALVPAVSAFAEADAPFDVRFTGVITAIGEPEKPWTIGGQTVQTDARTRVVWTVRPAAAVQWADVMASRLPDDTLLAREIVIRPEQVQLRGVVDAKPNTTDGAGDWVIAGVTVKATAETKFSTRGGPIEIDKWVEAVMQESAGGLTALRIAAIEPQDAVEVTGAIKEFTDTAWNLSSIKLVLDGDTTIVGKPVVGLIAHARAQLTTDSLLLARHLRVAWDDKRERPNAADFVGLIQKLPDAGLRGEWVVDGKTVVVAPSTRINQAKGLVAVGAEVRVEGVQASDKVKANVITVLKSSAEGGPFIMITGRIDALPQGGVIGVWVVAGLQVQVSTLTELQPRNVEPKEGMIARVQGVRRTSDGVIVATQIALQPGRPPHPPRPPRP